jgi:hypothetical protein
MNFMNKKIVAGILGLIGVLVIAGVFFFINNQKKDYVALVNNQSIPREDFEKLESQIFEQQGLDKQSQDEETKKMVQDQALDILIAQELLKQVSSNGNFEVTDTEVDAQFSDLKLQFGDEQIFNDMLKTENISEDTIKTQIREGILIEKYLNQQLNLSAITATQEEILEAYNLISATQEIGELKDVQTDIERYVVDQKQQQLIGLHIEDLKKGANIQFSI